MAAVIEVLILHGFQAKRGTLLYLKSWGPIGTSFNLNETWHIHCGMTRLHRSNNGLLAQELVSGSRHQSIDIPWISTKKRHHVIFKVMGPHLNLFQS